MLLPPPASIEILGRFMDHAPWISVSIIFSGSPLGCVFYFKFLSSSVILLLEAFIKFVENLVIGSEKLFEVVENCWRVSKNG